MDKIILSFAHYLPTAVWVAMYLYFGITLRRLPDALKKRYERYYTNEHITVITKCWSYAALLAFLITAISMMMELFGGQVQSRLVGLVCGIAIVIFMMILHIYIRIKERIGKE